MKHGKSARKASFRFHANPASEAILRVLRAYKRRKARPCVHVMSASVVAVYIQGIRDFIR